MSDSADTVRRFVARFFYRLGHRMDKIGWWVAETPSDRRIRRESKAAALADHLQAENEDLRDRLSIYESEAADPATRIPWAEAKAQLGIDGSHPAACGPGCRSQHTDDHSKCPAQCDGDAS